ncbi:MAG TPA: hypothetical protein VMT37_05940 [Solirubrobacterales bacterium]|nr:hypothetical protein [Solirubrobacterales bacterium]
MKFKVALALVAVAMLCTAAVAVASPKLPFYKAHAWSKAEVATWCEEESACDSWKLGPCHRFSRTRIDCAGVILSHRVNRYCAAIVVNKVIAGTDEFDSWFRSEQCGDLPAAE